VACGRKIVIIMDNLSIQKLKSKHILYCEKIKFIKKVIFLYENGLPFAFAQEAVI
jgi:hypothetical protein